MTKDDHYITREQLLSQYGTKPDTGLGRWRIAQQRRLGKVTPVSATWCRLQQEHRFVLEQGSREQVLRSIVRPLTSRYAIWSLTSINHLLVHQQIRRLTLVEVEKADMQEVFYHLQSRSIRNVILETDQKWVVAHVGQSDYDVIVRQLITKAPLEDVEKGIPSLEKIIVDLWVDGLVLGGISRTDLANVLRLAFTDYTIDLRTLRTYASRRNAKDDLIAYMDWLKVAPIEVLHDP